MLADGQVVMTSAWNGRMYNPIVREGKPFVILWDGQVWDIDLWGIVKGSRNLDTAMDFVVFATGTVPLADQTKYISYGPARHSSMALVGNDVQQYLPTTENNMKNAVQIDAQWWASRLSSIRSQFDAWLGEPIQKGLEGVAR